MVLLATVVLPVLGSFAGTNSLQFSDRSVYQLTSDWTTDAGNHIKLGELRGKPQVVAMIFTSCQGACPMLVHEMTELADSLSVNMRTNVGFLLVSFDPERDTPKTLHAYRVTRNLPANQWTLLHGRAEDVRELALVLGMKYRKVANGQFSHSNLITILNKEGEIVYQQSGVESAAGELGKQLNRLMSP